MTFLRAVREHLTLRAALALVVFAAVLAFRVRGLTRTFCLLADQVLYWDAAMGRWRDLPLVGASSVGATIGPAFYWVMWAIRRLVGPFTGDLPHAGGIGISILQSLADVALFLATARRFRSVWLALALVLWCATAPFDASLSATIWNPPVAVAFVKITLALALVAPARMSLWRVALITATAWVAVQVHSAAVFVAVPVCAGLVAEELARRAWRAALERARVVVETIAVLEIPLLIHLLTNRAGPVTPTLAIASASQTAGSFESLRIAASFRGFGDAVTSIFLYRSTMPAMDWLLLACAIAAAWRFRREPLLIALTTGVFLTTVAGFSLWRQGFQIYWFLPMAPCIALMLLAPFTAWERSASAVGVVLTVVVIGLIPSRYAASMSLHRVPEYAALLSGSRALRTMTPRVRAIHTDFDLPPTADRGYLYRILGGEIAPDSPLVAVIGRGGGVRLEQPPD